MKQEQLLQRQLLRGQQSLQPMPQPMPQPTLSPQPTQNQQNMTLKLPKL